jgi:GxxExxY protein
MARHELIEERLTRSAIGAFFDVYNTLGFGFLESAYVLCLERELIARGHKVSREVWVPVLYKGQAMCKQRLDMVVDGKLAVRRELSSRNHKHIFLAAVPKSSMPNG